MTRQELITKILGDHTEREGKVASLVLDYVADNPSWRLGELTLYEDKVVEALGETTMAMYRQPLGYFISSDRHRICSEARQMICLFLREETSFTLQKIAGIVGRDHVSVLYNIRRAEYKREKDDSFATDYEIFKNYTKNLL